MGNAFAAERVLVEGYQLGDSLWSCSREGLAYLSGYKLAARVYWEGVVGFAWPRGGPN